jgi:SAM-dependent methyltransferase
VVIGFIFKNRFAGRLKGVNKMWDQRYAEEGFAYGTKPNDFLRESMAKLCPGGKILCLAEGEGRNAVYLAENGYNVSCVDLSPVGLDKATALAQSRSVSIETCVADLKDYQISADSYDAIISIFCQLPPAIQEHMHGQIHKGLRPGGVYILEGFSKQQINYNTGGPRKPEMLMDLDSVKRELEPLYLQHAIETERLINEGKYHKGKGAVIQIIGIKN